MRRQPRRAAALTLAGALLLAGCGGNPAPKTLPSVSPTPTPTPSATPTPPVMPAAAKQRSKAGAEAGVRYFLDSLAFAGATGNTRELRSSYAKTCTRCEAIAVGIEETYSSGGAIRGGEWLPIELRFYAIKGGVAYVDAVVNYQAQIWIKKRGAPPVSSPARKGVLKTFQLTRTSGHWRVGALDPTT